jgi:hypothetical protein
MAARGRWVARPWGRSGIFLDRRRRESAGGRRSLTNWGVWGPHDRESGCLFRWRLSGLRVQVLFSLICAHVGSRTTVPLYNLPHTNTHLCHWSWCVGSTTNVWILQEYGCALNRQVHDYPGSTRGGKQNTSMADQGPHWWKGFVSLLNPEVRIKFFLLYPHFGDASSIVGQNIESSARRDYWDSIDFHVWFQIRLLSLTMVAFLVRLSMTDKDVIVTGIVCLTMVVIVCLLQQSLLWQKNNLFLLMEGRQWRRGFGLH